jgi:hypothetical protein
MRTNPSSSTTETAALSTMIHRCTSRRVLNNLPAQALLARVVPMIRSYILV